MKTASQVSNDLQKILVDNGFRLVPRVVPFGWFSKFVFRTFGYFIKTNASVQIIPVGTVIKGTNEGRPIQ